MYKLVFCDLDGTTVPMEGSVRPRVSQAMRDAAEAGAYVTVATGRSYPAVREHLENREIVANAPLVCCNGSLIVDPQAGQVLQVTHMDLSLAHDLMRLALAEQWEVGLTLGDLETFLENRTDRRFFLVRNNGNVLRETTDPISELSAPPLTFVISPPTVEQTPIVVERVQRFMGSRAQALAAGPRWVDIVMPGVSKANAAASVAELLGVRQDETIAIGDGDNDLEILRWAGLGIVMGNGTPRAKAAADWIAPPIEDDGVAIALQRFILGPRAQRQ